MIALRRIFLFFTLLIALLGCEKDNEFADRGYPRINTLPVTDISEQGANFHGEFTRTGDFHVKRYGFLWSTYNNIRISNSNMYIFSNKDEKAGFSVNINTSLAPGKKYYVRSFAETDDYLIYGPMVSFESQGSGPPVIESVTPTYVTAFDTLVVTGEGFRYTTYNYTVMIGSRLAFVASATNTELKVICPDGFPDGGKLSVLFAGYKATYDKPIYKLSPEVTSVSPREVTFNDTLHIEGNHFSLSRGYNIVKMGESYLQVLSADKTHLTARVLQSIETVESELTVTVDGEQVSCGTITLKAPEVQSVSPSLLTDPQQLPVTLKGENFHPVAEKNQVLIGGEVAEVVSASHEELVVEFPVALLPEDTSGFSATYDVEVTIIGQTGVLAGGVSVDF
jgi:hypothetical protein